MASCVEMCVQLTGHERQVHCGSTSTLPWQELQKSWERIMQWKHAFSWQGDVSQGLEGVLGACLGPSHDARTPVHSGTFLVISLSKLYGFGLDLEWWTAVGMGQGAVVSGQYKQYI